MMRFFAYVAAGTTGFLASVWAEHVWQASVIVVAAAAWRIIGSIADRKATS